MTKAIAEIRSLARVHSKMALRTLAGVAKNGKSESAKVAAAEALLNRGWGKAATVLENGEDGPLQILVRKFVEEGDK